MCSPLDCLIVYAETWFFVNATTKDWSFLPCKLTILLLKTVITLFVHANAEMSLITKVQSAWTIDWLIETHYSWCIQIFQNMIRGFVDVLITFTCPCDIFLLLKKFSFTIAWRLSAHGALVQSGIQKKTTANLFYNRLIYSTNLCGITVETDRKHLWIEQDSTIKPRTRTKWGRTSNQQSHQGGWEYQPFCYRRGRISGSQRAPHRGGPL